MEEKKEHIIAAAMRRFMHFGFSKTTMSEIAEDVRITKANLYYYYPEKSALIKDVIVFIANEYRARERALIQQEYESTCVLMERILDMRDEFIREHYILQMNENLEVIKGLSLNQISKDMHEAQVQTIFEIFKRGAESGELKPDNLLEAAEIYVDMMKGLSLMCNITEIVSGIPNPEGLKEVLPKQKLATRIFFEGLQL